MQVRSRLAINLIAFGTRSSCISVVVYLSASIILLRDYGGRRLQEDVLRWYPQAMTNMWPYLRAREAEVVQRRRVFDGSFLARFIARSGLPNPIARQLWASPDNSRQLLIAVRYVLTSE